jgi:hypothetical protein
MFTYTFMIMVTIQNGVFQAAPYVYQDLTSEQCISMAEAFNYERQDNARAVCVPMWNRMS